MRLYGVLTSKYLLYREGTSGRLRGITKRPGKVQLEEDPRRKQQQHLTLSSQHRSKVFLSAILIVFLV